MTTPLTLVQLAQEHQSWVHELAKEESRRGHIEAATFGFYLADLLGEDVGNIRKVQEHQDNGGGGGSWYLQPIGA